MVWWSDPPAGLTPDRRADRLPEPWLPAAFNGGHAYRDRVQAPVASAAGFYAARYRHSERSVWTERLAAGEIWCNGDQLRADGPLVAGDRLVWHRPPWQEAAVPVLPAGAIVFDDGDLLVLNKPAGLPVLPAGGFLDHTVLRQLEGWVAAGLIASSEGLPRPVHRLGRFTSGLLVCARRARTRAWLSAQLRESTAADGAAADGAAAEIAGQQRFCRKIYLALIEPLPADWTLGESRVIRTPIGRRPHPRLDQLWCAVDPGERGALASLSTLTLLERSAGVCRVQVAIATGRPHQIRIHCAAIGAPLLGDPLYGPGGQARSEVLPGDGGYRLQARSLELRREDGSTLSLEAPPPSW
ncbi:MAG: pseudouridine synthase [Cyanobacteriota bacterium]